MVWRSIIPQIIERDSTAKPLKTKEFGRSTVAISALEQDFLERRQAPAGNCCSTV